MGNMLSEPIIPNSPKKPKKIQFQSKNVFYEPFLSLQNFDSVDELNFVNSFINEFVNKHVLYGGKRIVNEKSFFSKKYIKNIKNVNGKLLTKIYKFVDENGIKKIDKKYFINNEPVSKDEFINADKQQ